MKKSKILCIALIYAISWLISTSSFSQEYYVKGKYRLIRSNTEVSLVAGVNVLALVQKYANDFAANLVASQQNSVVEYGLYRKSDQQGISMMIGLHSSVREAEESMLDALNYQINIIMEESPQYKIGESAWSRPSKYQPGFAFIRKNAVVYLHSSYPSTNVDIIGLARAIDQDLVNGAPYVTILDQIAPPVIHSVDLSKPVLSEGERSSLTINASDPNGRRIILYGNSLKGFGGVENESIIPWNDLRVIQLLHDEQLTGTHTIKCWVVNEDNLFSQVKEVQVTF
ncbi:MAG: hypothetical protein Q8O92_01605 [Candidatus Latescibacter sp.]|nr:hypothetical protein [Candidatus Latescibacter sp.]